MCHIFLVFLLRLPREFVVAVGEFYELYFKILVGINWWLGHGCCSHYA